MKKLLLICVFSVTLPNIVFAKCDGGREIKSTADNHVYCVSNNKAMNWWSAFAWCKANERRLATIEEVCNNRGWANGCGGLNGAGDVWLWTATPYGDDSAYDVHWGTVATPQRKNNHAALCY